MVKRTSTEEQILTVVKKLEAERRQDGAGDRCQYLYDLRLENRVRRNDPSEVVRVHHLEDENNRLKKLAVGVSLDREMLKALLTKNGFSS